MNEKVNFSELVNQVDQQLPNYSREAIELVAKTLFEQIEKNAKAGQNTGIRDFGTFSVGYQWVHADLDPETDEMKLILDLDFKPCLRLRKEIAAQTFGDGSFRPIEKLEEIEV